MKLTRVLTFSAILLLLFGTVAMSFGAVKTEAQNMVSVQLSNFGNGVASLGNEFTHSSAYAAKLVIPFNAQVGSGCMALYPYNNTLNSLQSFQIYASFNNATPRFVILLDTDADSQVDLVLLSDYQFLSNGAWQLSQGGLRWGWTKATPSLGEYGPYSDTLSYWKGIYGNAKVLSVGIALEYWAVKDNGGLNQPLYADEIVINGVTYNIASQQDIPVNVETQNTINIQLKNFGNGASSLSNEKTHTSAYAAKLMIPSGAAPGSECMALYPCNIALNSLQSFQVYTSFNNATPRFVIQLDTDGNQVADLVLLSDYQFLSNGAWQLSQGGQRWGWSEAADNLIEYGDYWDTLSYWKGIYGNAKVLSVGVALEYWAVKDAGGLNQSLYADEIVINGVTYNIAGPTQPIVTVDDDWPMFRHDLQRSGVSSTPVLSNNLAWRFFTGTGSLRATPTIVDGVVYIGSNGNSLYALNASTGGKIWEVSVGSNIESSVAVAYGMVYVGILWNGQNGYVAAYNASNGALVWRFATNSGIESSPAVVDGTVYIGSYTGYVYALNAYTGALKWTYSTGSSTFSSPAVVDDVVYIGSLNGKVFALNAGNGALIWSYQTGSQVYASPAVVEGKVFVCSDNGDVFALNANDGQKIWQANCGVGTDHTDTSPAVANGMVYVNARNGIYAYNASNGLQIWFFTSPYSNRQLTGYMYSSPAVSGNIVYYGSVDSFVFALNAFNGSMIWSYQTGGFLFSSPAITNGALYIGSYDGYVYALGNYSVRQVTQPTPIPTPAPTATPTPTASPNAATTDPTPVPSQEPLQASNPIPDPTGADPVSQIETGPNAASVPTNNISVDWMILAVILTAGLVTLASLLYIFRPQ